MDREVSSLIDELSESHSLGLEGYRRLVELYSDRAASLLAERAFAVRRQVYGTAVFIRGLIEISNICRNDCLYCGIRRSNARLRRYRLDPDTIVACAREGHALGFRTIVLQGGEDPHFDDDVLCDIVARIVVACPDTAVTLSMGERSDESYRRLFEAGATRYLLRHETATKAHYELLHPSDMSFERRMRCLRVLRDVGFQVGAGMMVGAPFQTTADLAADLKFIEEFKPDMAGIGPFIPHHDTPFADMPAGTVELTCYLLSIVRLIHPSVLMPATTALASIDAHGRERGMLAGANVVMPNLSPVSVRKDYALYDNKAALGSESAQARQALARQMEAMGLEVVVARGDVARA